MRFTENRQVYDLEKEEKIIEVQKSFGTYGENPDNDWTEALYLKNHDEYFVYGAGGKNTPFSDDDIRINPRYKQIRYPGRVIVWKKNNLENAKLWVHDNCPDKQDAIFGAEDPGMLRTTTITLTDKARKNLKRCSREKGLTVSEIIRQYAEGLYEE